MHFNRYVHYWSRRAPEAIVLTCDGSSLTWGQLDAQSAGLAAYLQAQGIEAGDRVGCLLPNSLEWCVAFVASFRLGAIFVPLNTMFGRFELEQISGDAECRAVISSPREIGKLGHAQHQSSGPEDAVLIYDWLGHGEPAALADIVTESRGFVDHRRSDDDAIAICYTSGTTGTPKGILLTHRSVDTMVQSLILNFNWDIARERFLILAPLAFTGTVICVLAPLLATGGRGYIEKSMDPVRALALIVEERITYMGGVPAIWQRVAAAPGFADADISCLKAGNVGGAPPSRALLDTFLAKGVILRHQYGTSESSGAITSPEDSIALERPDSCGHPLPTFDLEIRDEAGQRALDGSTGEIYIRGPQMMQCYWRNPDATRAAMGDGWYRTGDLGRYDRRWGLFVLDRKKNMLISGGVNVYPAEVERAIATLDGIEEIVVLGVKSERWGDEVVAIAYAPTLQHMDRVVAQARELLGAYKTPRRIVSSPTPLPRTATGKISRGDLQALFAALSCTAPLAEKAV
jgi:fatty-acyl-CoA synthase